MDVSSSSGVARGVQNARKEWRAVSDHHPSQFPSDGEADCLGKSDDRTIYEVLKGRENADVNFCSITIDGDMQIDVLQQRLNQVSRQREELEQMEIELRAQVIVRAKMVEIQNTFETKIKEHANNTTLLQEQINVRDERIQDLERRIEEKDKEIHAIKLDNEEAWAKESLLREQNKELASFRERHIPEAERAQHIQQIHDLQDHIKEKERQFLELQEQQRVAQETIGFKDEQLREAHAWMNRAQELDALHNTTNQSLQIELRDRAEQYNQLWLGCQRQFAEMERLHFNAVQKLQLELADVKESNGIHQERSHIMKDAPQLSHTNGHHDASGSDSFSGKSAEQFYGNEEHASHFAAIPGASQGEHNMGIPFTPSMLGLSPFLAPAPIAVHPYMIHQQGVPSPASSHVPQNHDGHFQSVQTNSPMQYEQYQQYETSVTGQNIPQHVDASVSQGISNGYAESTTNEEPQAQKSVVDANPVEIQSQHSLQNISSQFQDTLNLNDSENKKIQDGDFHDSNDHIENATRSLPKTNTEVDASVSDAPFQSANFKELPADSNPNGAAPQPIAAISASQTNLSSMVKTPDSLLLDERLLLACIARTIPASGKISISSTLPNRLAKMLAPLHWHDYKKIYGKLDDFVMGHSELFVIEGDFIRLKEGAHRKIAATAAAAKLAAAAATLSTHSSYMPSVAVTPMAQSYRGNQGQQSNGIHYNVLGGQPRTKNMSISADPLDLNGSENAFIRPNVSTSATNGLNVIGHTNARMPANFARQHGRDPGAAPKPQR